MKKIILILFIFIIRSSYGQGAGKYWPDKYQDQFSEENHKTARSFLIDVGDNNILILVDEKVQFAYSIISVHEVPSKFMISYLVSDRRGVISKFKIYDRGDHYLIWYSFGNSYIYYYCEKYNYNARR